VPSRSSAFIDALFVVVVGVGFALAFAFSSSATAAAAFGAFASFDEVAALFRRFSAFSTMSAWCGSASSSSSVPPSDDGSGDGDGDARARRFFPRGFPPIAAVARARSATRRDARNFSRREAFALMSTRALNENRWFLHRGGDVCIKSASMHTMYDARASARPRRLRPPPPRPPKVSTSSRVGARSDPIDRILRSNRIRRRSNRFAVLRDPISLRAHHFFDLNS
jgi:hypothetical protein